MIEMKEDIRNKIALFRYGVISPLVTGTYDDEKSKKAFFRYASTKVYQNYLQEDTKISATTIERWYYQYKNKGFDGLKPLRRSDTGKLRKLEVDTIDQINYLKKEYPRIPATLIYQKLIDNGTITKKDVSLSTITRYINRLHIENKYTTNKDMRRYEREHINEVWCGDSSVGPYLKIDGKKQRTYIIALIDDASRMIVGIDLFFNDNFINLMSVMKSAITKYGRPSIFNFDNGSPYKNQQMTLLAARIGTTLNYCAPYTPTSKSKLERWFRTLKDHWMASLNMTDFNSLEELRTSLFTYVQFYNQTIHTSLNGLSPQDRFFRDTKVIRRMEERKIEEIFLLEIERRVSNDNVVVIDAQEYEVEYRYAKQRITIRYSPDLSTRYVVDHHTGELTKLKKLNKIENAHIKREKIKLTGGNDE